MNTDAIAAALTDALPILAATAMPALAVTAGVALWVRAQIPTDDDYGVDDYKPTTTGRATVYRYQPPIDGPTQVIARRLPDAGTPVYDQLAATHTALKWLREIAANHAFVNGGANEGGLR